MDGCDLDPELAKEMSRAAAEKRTPEEIVDDMERDDAACEAYRKIIGKEMPRLSGANMKLCRDAAKALHPGGGPMTEAKSIAACCGHGVDLMPTKGGNWMNLVCRGCGKAMLLIACDMVGAECGEIREMVLD